jgi:hypothetical protein
MASLLELETWQHLPSPVAFKLLLSPSCTSKTFAIFKLVKNKASPRIVGRGSIFRAWRRVVSNITRAQLLIGLEFVDAIILLSHQLHGAPSQHYIAAITVFRYGAGSLL